MVRVPDGKIGLLSSREIGASEELRVWFGAALSEEIGLYSVREEDKQGSDQLTQGPLTLASRYFWYDSDKKDARTAIKNNLPARTNFAV